MKEKFNLKDVKHALKKEELRAIHGGCGCGAPAGQHCYIVNGQVHNIFGCAPGLTCVPNPLWNQNNNSDWIHGICT